jgi:hypothetical protein
MPAVAPLPTLPLLDWEREKRTINSFFPHKCRPVAPALCHLLTCSVEGNPLAKSLQAVLQRVCQSVCPACQPSQTLPDPWSYHDINLHPSSSAELNDLTTSSSLSVNPTEDTHSISSSSRETNVARRYDILQHLPLSTTKRTKKRRKKGWKQRIITEDNTVAPKKKHKTAK